MTFALAGNQNSGKTTLFNELTGSNQHVGNWPGVTVEKKEGRVKGSKDTNLVDLPGIYSLSPYTPEEIVTRNFMVDGGVDGVINIVDATNIERNLYLTLQLMELGRPMVVALNMMDEVRAVGDSIDAAALERALGIPVIPISARKRDGIDKLVKQAVHVATHKHLPPVLDICQGALHEALHSIAVLTEEKAREHGYTPRFAATKLVEGDEPMQKALALSQHEIHVISEIVEMMEHKSHLERDAALADARYQFIEGLVSRYVHRKRGHGELTLSNKIDEIVTNKVLAIPVFCAIMLLVFTISFGFIGTFLADSFSALLEGGVELVSGWLVNVGASEWVHSLIVDGVLAGITSVLGFLPVILLLFLCLSLLEDSGYMARAAFVMDGLLRRTGGLSGRSFIPMLMGFGCSVPATMATRTLEGDRDKRFTITLIPFMSCGAKVPIYGLFVMAFFTQARGLVMLSIYLLGILVAVLSAFLLKKTLYKGEAAPFVMELPTYRLPTMKNVAMLLWDKAKDFLRRAFTVIFVATVIIWFLQSFGTDLRFVSDNADSILAKIGGFIAPIFKPLGFGTWQASTSILTGFMAKESVVSTMAVLYSGGDDAALATILNQLFTPLTAWSFMAFTLLYMPCVAAFAAMRREMGGFKYALGAVAYQTGVAWIVALLIFQVGRLFIS